MKENRFYKRVCTKSMVALVAVLAISGTASYTQHAYAVDGKLNIPLPFLGNFPVNATININQGMSASDTIIGPTILEHHNFGTENKTKQVLVTSPTTEDSLFKFNSTFQMKQSQKLLIPTLWGALVKPDLSNASTLAELAKPEPKGMISYVDLIVTLDNRLSYADATGLIQKAYFTSETWRPVYVFDAQYNQLADVRNTYVENVPRKEFNIPTGNVKKFIIRVVPIANKDFSVEQQDAPMSFGFDTPDTNNFKVSVQDANEIAVNRRTMTDAEKAEEKRIVEKDLNIDANKLTPTEVEMLRRHNIFVTGEIGGKVWGRATVPLLGTQTLSANVNNILPPAGVAVTFANPEVTFMKNTETDTAKDKIASVYVDYNSTIPNDTLTDQSVPANPTRDGYTFVGWSENKDSKTADFYPETAIITENKTVYAIWAQVFNVTYTFDKQVGVTQELPQALKDRLANKNKENVPNGTEVTTQDVDKSNYVDTDNHGTWTFVSWDKDTATVTDADVAFKGTWNFVPDTTYNVTYNFDKQAGVTQELPQALKDRLNNKNRTNVPNGTFVNTLDIDTQDYKDADNQGVWIFNGWDKDDATVTDSDVIFKGTWRFESDLVENKTYHVTYQFKKADDVTVPFPQELEKRTENVSQEVHTTDVVKPMGVNTTEYVDVDSHGKWVFVSWDKENETVSDSNVVFIGTWNFVPDTTYNVTYNFDKQAGVTQELPQALKDRLNNKNRTNVPNGIEVSTKDIDTSDYIDKENKGKWIFVSWDKKEDMVSNSNVVFKGEWNFKPYNYQTGAPSNTTIPTAYIATYLFKEKSGRALPQELQDRLNDTTVVGKSGEEVTVSAIDTSTYKDQTGTWIFVAWDKEKAIFDRQNIVFIGEWIFTPEKEESTTSRIIKRPEIVVTTTTERGESSTEKKVSKASHMLPKTNASDSSVWTIIGTSLVVLSARLFKRSKENK
ncbi:SHIRT domain-containing protein [Granulicatella sp. zg-ZJ]|uniref:SHIRT domain-containing protein n=1 Tax=Granulicatella sp. zg-ZJ TaxID=2678504 RepID=UPI0013D038AB|nr:SHIRT domain-containing protein [Granulicatella sp. zg-ZJ]